MLVLAGILLALYAGFVSMRILQPRLNQGELLQADGDAVYLLEYGQPNPRATVAGYRVRLDGGIDAVELLIADPSASATHVTVRQGESTLFEHNPTVSNAQRLRFQVEIDPDETRELTIELEGASAVRGSNVFIGMVGSMDAAVELGGYIRVFEMGLLLTMALYGVTLFLFKRSERYMLRFVLYTSLLFFETFLFLSQDKFPPTANLFVAARTLIIVVTMMLSVDIGYRLMGVNAPRWLHRLLDLPSIATIGLAFAGAALLFWSVVGSWLQIVYNAAAVAAALYGVYKAPRENLFLAATFLISIVACANGSLFRFLDLSESFLYSMLFTAPLFNVPFAIACMVAVNRRFARKFAEAEQLNVELDRKVAERTESLHEQQEQRHQLMLNVFHDLRSPLFAVKGCAEVMAADSSSAEEYAPIVLERTEYMSRITNDLFFLAKLEDGRVLFTEDAYDLAGVLREVAEAYEVEAQSRGVRIEVSAPASCIAAGDRQRVKQAIGNIVANAVHFTQLGTSVGITMHVEPPEKEIDDDTEDSEHRALVEIADEGPGLTSDEIADVFRQYYCKDRSPESSSTGIGLSIADGIVRHMGGRIDVRSAPGTGSVFTVTLPL